MSQSSQADEAGANESQATTSRGFHIAPEGGTFLTTWHRYMTTLRHLNCRDYYQQRAEAWKAALGTSEIPCPEDCSCTIPLEILSGYQAPDSQDEAPRWVEVCSGECNEGNPGEEYNDQDLSNILYYKAQALCDDEHLKGVEVVEIERARVAWSETAPIPAYFSPTKGRLEAHSSTITSGHLALMQVRNHVDVIEVEFRTHDCSQVEREGGQE